MSSNESLSSYVTANENFPTAPILPLFMGKSVLRAILFANLGLSSLVGWNSWITAKSYFAFKLKYTMYADNFNNFFSLGYMSFYMLGLIFQKRIDLFYRILLGYVMLIAVFLICFIIISIPMQPNTFFIIIMILIVLSGIASSLLSGIFSLAASYPPFYTSAITSGQGFGGLVPAVSQLVISLSPAKLSNLFQSSEDGSAKAYFLISVLISVLGLLSYFGLLYLEKKDIISQNSGEIQYFLHDDASEGSQEIETEIQVSRSAILQKIFGHVISVFLTLGITLSLFPSITSSILPQHNQTNLFITVHFLVYNLADWIGKSIPGLFKISRPTLHFLSYSRLLFIPLFFHCNIHIFDNDQVYRPIVWFNDASFFLLLVIFGLSNGYISTLLLMDAPQILKDTEWDGSLEAQRFVGDCMVFGLGVGLTVGALSSFALRSYLCLCNPFTRS